ncbi:hypothetical protein B0H14DRAFT_3704701 [Mycena olivaceomarginata]|nr:hypothetical protein B0H14DRAFT_3704701 [Mycena olivaceomarginata]
MADTVSALFASQFPSPPIDTRLSASPSNGIKQARHRDQLRSKCLDVVANNNDKFISKITPKFRKKMCRTPNSACYAARGTTSGPRHEEDVTHFCVAVVQQHTVTPVQGALGALPTPEQASTVAMPSEPTCARLRTNTAKLPPPPSKSPSPQTHPPSAIRTRNPCPASTPPVHPGHLHAHRVPHAQQLHQCECALAQSSFRNSTSVAPDLHVVASLARNGTGLPTTTDPWHVSDAMLTPAGAASAQSDSLRIAARKNKTVVPGAWSSVRSAHVCGKPVSTSALVDVPAPPPALNTHVQAGEGERDADTGPSSGALSLLRTVTHVFRGVGGASVSLRTPAPAVMCRFSSTRELAEP